MKFTNEQAVEALRAELTNKGRKTLHMSERTLASQTEILVRKLATDETGLPEFVTDAIEILNGFEGDARKKDSDFAKYKEAHPETEPKPQDADTPKPTDDSKLKAYEERIAALEKRLKDADTKSVLDQKRTDLISKLKEKGVKDDEWIEDFISEVNITEDLDVDTKAEKWLKVYNKQRSKNGNSVPPVTPSGSGSDSKISEAIKAAADLVKRDKAQGVVQTN